MRIKKWRVQSCHVISLNTRTTKVPASKGKIVFWTNLYFINLVFNQLQFCLFGWKFATYLRSMQRTINSTKNWWQFVGLILHVLYTNWSKHAMLIHIINQMFCPFVQIKSNLFGKKAWHIYFKFVSNLFFAAYKKF